MFADYAETLRDTGWQSIIPLRHKHKAPAISGWQAFNASPPTDEQIAHWVETMPNAGIGLAFGPDKLVGVDLDFLNPEDAAKSRSIAAKHFGSTPLIRVGQPPKILAFYRCDEDLSSVSRAYGGFELYTNSGQCVLFGIHPDTDNPYTWPNEAPDAVGPDDLPAITLKQVNAFVQDMAPLRQDTARVGKATVHNAGRTGEWLKVFNDATTTEEMIAMACEGIRNVGAGSRHFTMQAVTMALVMKGVHPSEYIHDVTQAYTATLTAKEAHLRGPAVTKAAEWACNQVWGTTKNLPLPAITVDW